MQIVRCSTVQLYSVQLLRQALNPRCQITGLGADKLDTATAYAESGSTPKGIAGLQDRAEHRNLKATHVINFSGTFALLCWHKQIKREANDR